MSLMIFRKYRFYRLSFYDLTFPVVNDMAEGNSLQDDIVRTERKYNFELFVFIVWKVHFNKCLYKTLVSLQSPEITIDLVSSSDEENNYEKINVSKNCLFKTKLEPCLILLCLCILYGAIPHQHLFLYYVINVRKRNVYVKIVTRQC